jgi:hypothetical protein
MALSRLSNSKRDFLLLYTLPIYSNAHPKIKMSKLKLQSKKRMSAEKFTESLKECGIKFPEYEKLITESTQLSIEIPFPTMIFRNM